MSRRVLVVSSRHTAAALLVAQQVARESGAELVVAEPLLERPRAADVSDVILFAEPMPVRHPMPAHLKAPPWQQRRGRKGRR